MVENYTGANMLTEFWNKWKIEIIILAVAIVTASFFIKCDNKPAIDPVNTIVETNEKDKQTALKEAEKYKNEVEAIKNKLEAKEQNELNLKGQIKALKAKSGLFPASQDASGTAQGSQAPSLPLQEAILVLKETVIKQDSYISELESDKELYKEALLKKDLENTNLKFALVFSSNQNQALQASNIAKTASAKSEYWRGFRAGLTWGFVTAEGINIAVKLKF